MPKAISNHKFKMIRLSDSGFDHSFPKNSISESRLGLKIRSNAHILERRYEF